MNPPDLDRILPLVRTVLVVDEVANLTQPVGALTAGGRLITSASEALDAIDAPLRNLGYLPLLDRAGNRDVMTLIPYAAPAHRSRPALALFLLALTAMSVLFVGASMVHPDLVSILKHPFSGWPFALSMLAILGTHEMGHYLVARRGGVLVSLPYFIPMPIGPLGTMGAFINMRSVPRNRSQVLRIGMAGPLSGMVVTLVVLIYGLSTSAVGATPVGEAYLQEGNSLLYLLLKWAVLGRRLPAEGLDVMLNPVAFAGWAGLLVTGLNLIPAAQLDGGHVVFSLIGARARILTMIVAGGMLLLGFIWPGWFVWAVLVFLLGSRPHVVQDSITPLTRRERLAAVAVVLLAVMLFPPVPLAIVSA